MIPKSGYRFSDQIMRKRIGMIPTRRAALAQSGQRFFEKVMPKIKEA